MKYEIKHGLPGAVLFTADIQTTRQANCNAALQLEQATAVRAYLCDANLRGAYL